MQALGLQMPLVFHKINPNLNLNLPMVSLPNPLAPIGTLPVRNTKRKPLC